MLEQGIKEGLTPKNYSRYGNATPSSKRGSGYLWKLPLPQHIIKKKRESMFASQNYNITVAGAKDGEALAAVYNSNSAFLVNHLGVSAVSAAWVRGEMGEMEASGFSSCKIVEMKSGKTVGLIDFKPGEEAYLSLLMVAGPFKNTGVGTEVFFAFLNFVQSNGGKRIRIDVALHGDEAAYKFWQGKGFLPEEKVVLTWNGKKTDAVKMIWQNT